MSNDAATTGTPTRDRPLVLYDLLNYIAWRKAAGAERAEVERLAAGYRRPRLDL